MTNIMMDGVHRPTTLQAERQRQNKKSQPVHSDRQGGSTVPFSEHGGK